MCARDRRPPAPPAWTPPRLDVIATKLTPPATRTSLVLRPAQMRRLEAAASFPVIAIIGPAGSGKSTVAAMWAREDSRPFAWYTADDRDADPATLLRGLAAAVDGVEPLDERILAAVARPGPSIWTAAMPRLGSAIRDRPPFVLVVDDMDRIANAEAVEAVVTLAGHLPPESQLVLIGRSRGALPLARLVSKGQSFVLDRDALALTRDEVGLVARSVGVHLPADRLEAVHRQTEGWATGVYLSLIAARDGIATAGLAESSSMLEDYVRSEVLPTVPEPDLEFILRTSPLERLSGPLCDEVLDRAGTGSVLDRLERSNFFVLPLDSSREWFRYHALFSQVLGAELHRRDHRARPEILRRAAAWHSQHGSPEIGLEYALAAGDDETAARLLGSLAQSALNSGRTATLRRWFSFFDRPEVGGRHPVVAVLGAIMFSIEGDSARADRWLGISQEGASLLGDRRDDELDGMLALGRGVLCPDGAEALQRDTERAVALLPESHPFRVTALVAQGIAHTLRGEHAAADVVLASAVSAWERSPGADTAVVVALVHRAWMAMAQNDWAAAERHVRHARQMVAAAGLAEQAAGLCVDVANARLAMHHGAAAQARRDLAHAQRIRHLAGYAIPWLAVRLRLELARVGLAASDPAAARTMLDEIREILERRPGLGVLVDDVNRLEVQLRAQPAVDASGASSLTAAELRLLPLLTTHLTFEQIGAQLFVTRSTVKSQAKSIYRKLGAESRAQAVDLAIGRGLLESASVPSRRPAPDLQALGGAGEVGTVPL
jgi:LuxR family maltose regulon positive regulatory protein